MRIDKSRKNDLIFTIDLKDFFSILLKPWISQGVFGPADRNNLASEAEHGGVFEDGELFQIGPAPWRIATRSPQRQELSYVY